MYVCMRTHMYINYILNTYLHIYLTRTKTNRGKDTDANSHTNAIYMDGIYSLYNAYPLKDNAL